MFPGWGALGNFVSEFHTHESILVRGFSAFYQISDVMSRDVKFIFGWYNERNGREMYRVESANVNIRGSVKDAEVIHFKPNFPILWPSVYKPIQNNEIK